jgi:hypothetical protein
LQLFLVFDNFEINSPSGFEQSDSSRHDFGKTAFLRAELPNCYRVIIESPQVVSLSGFCEQKKSPASLLCLRGTS